MLADNSTRIAVLLDSTSANAAARQTSKEIDNIGDAGKRAGVSASAGLSQVEAQIVRSSASTRQYTEAERQRTAAMREAAIASGNASLADAQRKAALFNEQVALKEAALAEKGKAMSAAETEAMAQRVAAAERARAAATQAAAAADTEAAGASSLSVAQMLRAGGAIDKLALGVNTGARQLSVLAGAFNAASLGQFAMIIGASLLIGELIKLFKSSEENRDISDALIKSDSALAIIFDRMAAAAGGTNSALTGQAANFKQLLSLDYASALNSYLVAYEKLAPEIEKSKDAESGRIAAEKLLRQVEVEAADALKNHTGNYGELKQSIDIASASLEFQKGQLDKSSVARDKESAEVEKHALALIKLGQETGRSTEEIRAQVAALYNGANAADYFAALVLKAADAQYQLNAAVRDFHPVALNTGAQAGIVRQMQEGLARDIAGGASLAQVEPRIKALQKAAAELASSEAAARGEALSFNEAHQRTRQIMLDDFGVLSSYVDKLPVYEKNLSNATAAKESHGRASHAAAQAIRDENVILQMQVELLHAQQQLGKESFNQEADLTVQEFKIKEQSFINKARLQKFSDDQIKQGIAIIRQLELAALDEISQKEGESIRKRTEEENRYLTHQRTERERMVKEYEHNIREQEKLERDFTQTIQEEEARRAKIILQGAVERARAEKVLRDVLTSHGISGSDANVSALASALSQLKKEYADVATNAATAKTAVQDLNSHFGGGVAGAIAMKIALQQLTTGSVSFGSAFKTVFSEVFLTVDAAVAVFQGFGSMFASLFENLVTGTESTKAIILRFVADLLRTLGQMAIAVGTILLFLPVWLGGNPGLGAALIGAGIAAMALSGVFAGLAANASKAHQSQGVGASTGTSAGSTSSSGGPAPPNVIQFPTSGPLSGGPVTNVFKLDYQGTKDFLAGRVVTQEALNNPNSPEVRKIKKHARAS